MTPVTVIAEAGVNHNGDMARALEMVHAGAEAGADYVKFQAFRADELVSSTGATAAYQLEGTGKRDQLSLLKELELDLDGFARLAEECRKAGIGFMCTPFDMSMTPRLLALGMDRIKIPSGELTNKPMLAAYGRLEAPIILSTGMSSMEEVSGAVEVLNSSGCNDITLLHCTSLYPAPPETLNLKALVTMREVTGLPVGYSDHSTGDHAIIAAVALGAVVVEKHFTLDRSLPGPDHAASMEKDDLAAMIRKIRELSVALGDGEKRPARGEDDIARLVRRSWHAARDLEAGTILREDDIVLKRPCDGLPPGVSPVGCKLKAALKKDTPVLADQLKGRVS